MQSRSRVLGVVYPLCLVFASLPACSGSVGQGGESQENGPGGTAEPGSMPESIIEGQCDTKAFLKSRLVPLADQDLKTLVTTTFGGSDKSSLDFTIGGTPQEPAENRSLSSAGFSAYRAAMFAAARKQAAALPADSPCLGAARANDCADGVLKSLLEQLFHGPLRDSDWQRIKQSHADMISTYGPREAFEGALAAALLAPQTLFQTELGESKDQGEDVLRLSNAEALSQASIALTGNVADAAALRDVTGLGANEFAAELAKKVQGWVASPAFRTRIKAWGETWMGVSHLDEVQREGVDFSTELKTAMRDEALAFFESNLLAADGSFDKLLGGGAAPPAKGLQSIYGANAPWDPKQRRGFLSLPAVLTAHASPTASDPVQRGLLVRIGLLCEAMPPPVANADFSKVQTSPDMQTRERFDTLAQAPACSGCHQVINPPGYLFENFDHLGRWRTEEKGRPVNARAGVPSFFGEVNYEGAEDLQGVAELSTWLAKSPRARECFAVRMMEYVLADALPDGVDNCALQGPSKRFVESGSITDLLSDIVTSDLFLFRTHGGS